MFNEPTQKTAYKADIPMSPNFQLWFGWRNGGSCIDFSLCMFLDAEPFIPPRVL